GRIACANVLSDLYAMGITECDNLLMLLSLSTKMTDQLPTCASLCQPVPGSRGASLCHAVPGHAARPWCQSVSCCARPCSQAVVPVCAILCQAMQPGRDVLVLTKPLGTQVAVTAHQWLDIPERWSRLQLVVSREEVEAAYQEAVLSMATLNR
ncbi:SPS2 dikinase, partial [Eubucco bourcierii]|nr:SPS2 dikinase [Eubucco bourcierii]